MSEEERIKKELNRKKIKITGIHYFAKGKRGIVYAGFLKRNNKRIKIVIKIKNPKSETIARIENEAKWLKNLNKFRIGPKLYGSGSDFIVMEFVDGTFIGAFLERENKKNIIEAVKKIFLQLYKLDKLKVDKEEMHHPVKHIIIDKKNNPVLIDFERARITYKPKNVTQFCQYITSSFAADILKRKGIELSKEKIIQLATNYKRKIIKKNLSRIINYV